jgi:putative membrane protein
MALYPEPPGAAALIAHSGPPPVPGELASAWASEPVVVVAVVLAGLLYARGVRGIWHRSGVGRGVGVARAASFAAGLAAVLVAVASPLDALSAALFSAHMGQHLLLVLVAAPLLVLGSPLLAFSRAVRPGGRRALGRLERAVGRLGGGRGGVAWMLGVWALNTVVLWAWHAPVLYEAAVRNPLVHTLEHVTLLGAALVFWWTVVDMRRRASPGIAVLGIFLASVQSVALAALIAFSSEPWYAVHAGHTAPWGLSPLEDQQLAGVLMWVPGGAVHLVAGAAVFASWLSRGDRGPSGPAPALAVTPRR